MAELKLNLDSIEAVRIATGTNTDGSTSYTYPLGVDFPDGTKWRKTVDLLNPAPPANPKVFYALGNAIEVGSEHTPARKGVGLITTPRWRDDVTAIVDTPRGWYCSYDNNHWSQINAIPTQTSYYDGTRVTSEQAVLTPLVHIYNPSASDNIYTATIEIYNPSAATVSWDIVDKTGASCGATLIKSWSNSPTAAKRTIGPYSKISATISASTSRLTTDSSTWKVGTEKYFSVQTTHIKYISRNLNYVVEGTNWDYKGIPFKNVANSESFRLIQCLGGRCVVASGTFTGVPIELKHSPFFDTNYNCRCKVVLKNPWCIGLEFSAHYSTHPAFDDSRNPGTPIRMDYNYIGPNSTMTFNIPYDVDEYEPEYFMFMFNNSLTTCWKYRSMPLCFYPAVITVDSMSSATGNGGKGATITYRMTTYNDFEVRFGGLDIALDETATVTSTPHNNTLLRGEGSSETFTFKITEDCSVEGLYLDFNFYMYPENYDYDMWLGQKNFSFGQYFKPLNYNPSVQSASMVDSYESCITVENENDCGVWCHVAVRGVMEWIDPATGKTTYRPASWFHQRRYICAGDCEDFNFIFNDSQGSGDVEYAVYFYNDDRLPTTLVEGYCS
jgi:hypothetical protein